MPDINILKLISVLTLDMATSKIKLKSSKDTYKNQILPFVPILRYSKKTSLSIKDVTKDATLNFARTFNLRKLTIQFAGQPLES